VVVIDRHVDVREAVAPGDVQVDTGVEAWRARAFARRRTKPRGGADPSRAVDEAV
jgi:hypothetical protein